ncbi:MAG: exonuclease [Paracoccaceae bacterium]|nr:exonuclease [Paracoccaceae bacterium]
MDHTVVFDCEFLTTPGAPQRFWCGLDDPDPVVAQIGAVKLQLDAEAELTETFECVVKPPLRGGGVADVPPFFQELTGVTADRIAQEGLGLEDALAELSGFADGAAFWSWGKDEFNLLAISCYVAGFSPPLPVTRFGNAVHLLAASGVPKDDIATLRSNTMTEYFGLPHPERPGHDALGDAQSVALVLQHLIRTGRLVPEALRTPSRPGTA